VPHDLLHREREEHDADDLPVTPIPIEMNASPSAMISTSPYHSSR
jgi:hypothetical protein